MCIRDRSHPIPSHPRPSLHPSSPGPASRRGEGWGGCAHPAARRLARRGARHADPLLPRRGARPGLGRGRGGEPGGLGPTGAWTSPGAAARTPPPRGAREVGGRARAPLRLLPSFPPGGSGRPAVPAVPAVPRRPPARPGRPAPPRSRGPTVPGRPAPRWRRLASATTRAAEAGPLALSRCDQPTWSPAPPRPLPPATRRARVSAPPRVDQQAVPSRPPPFPVRGT